MRFVLRILSFSLLTALIYALLVGVLALVEVNDKPLFEGLTRLMLRPVESGHTAVRMAEFDSLAATHTRLDALFVGSSLTYRGIDARQFAARDQRVFALGLSSQSPLNYRGILRDALPRLRPDLVVFEANPDLFTTDGTEAFYAFAVNQPLGARTVRMGAAVRSVKALNVMVALAWYRLAHPFGSEDPLPPEDPTERYVGAGFTERAGTLTPDSLQRALQRLALPQPLRARQLDALSVAVIDARRAGSRTALVAPPIHPAHLDARPALAAQADTLQAFAARLDVPYIDLSRLPLDPLADFQDLTHLSARGVARYNAALLDSLVARGLLRAP